MTTPPPPVPSTILHQFFQLATERLNEHPVNNNKKQKSNDEHNEIIPPNLAYQRQTLLRIQLDSLAQVINDSNTDHEDDEEDNVLTMEQAQNALKLLGYQDFSSISFSDNDDDDDDDDDEKKKQQQQQSLLDASNEMNEAARLSFARSILYAELDYEDLVKNGTCNQNDRKLGSGDDKDDQTTTKMEKGDILEWCSLCRTMIKLPQVKRYLVDSTDIRQPLDDSKDDKDPPPKPPPPPPTTTTPPNKRLEHMQNLMIRSVGYDPSYATRQIQSQFYPDGHAMGQNPSNDDEELLEAFTSLIKEMLMVMKETISSIMSRQAQSLDNGTTRVSEVHYSEHMVDRGDDGGSSSSGDVAGVPPSTQTMQEQMEARRQAQMKMMREAAAMQQKLLHDLMMMEEGERNEVLERGKKVHDEFMKEAMTKKAGPERMMFLQGMGGEDQRLMAMHKLWEKMLKDNGGKAPVMMRKQGMS